MGLFLLFSFAVCVVKKEHFINNIYTHTRSNIIKKLAFCAIWCADTDPGSVTVSQMCLSIIKLITS